MRFRSVYLVKKPYFFTKTIWVVVTNLTIPWCFYIEAAVYNFKFVSVKIIKLTSALTRLRKTLQENEKILENVLLREQILNRNPKASLSYQPTQTNNQNNQGNNFK